MPACQEIGSWAAGLAQGDVPHAALERARLQTAAVLAAGAAGEQAARRVAAVAPGGPVGEVYRGAAASMAHDWDDYLFMGHTGHSAVWAARAFTGDASRALVAQVAANEVAGRLGAALFLGPHNGQFWSSIHCAGAAVAAGVAMGLDAGRLSHALAIALYQPPYGLWPGFMGPETKLLTAAEPAAQGARAAQLAAEGMRGALDVIEHPRGMLTHLSFVPRPQMLGGLGAVWLTETLAFKPLPGCAYLQPAVASVLAAGLAADEVDAIDVDAGHLTCAMERLGASGELTAVRVNFSTALSIAVSLIAGRLTHAELAPDWLSSRRDQVLALAARVRVHHDWELTARTARGSIDAGASLAGVSAGDWLRVARRSGELHMDEARVGAGDLVALLRDRRARRALGPVVRKARRGAAGIEALDTAALRMTFPCRLRVRLRGGRVRELEGIERGSCGHPLDEQRAVVAEKCRLAGVDRSIVDQSTAGQMTHHKNAATTSAPTSQTHHAVYQLPPRRDS